MSTRPPVPDATGHFGPYGGRFVPETLMHPLHQLEQEYLRAKQDPAFQRELDYYLKEFCGRPTPLYLAVVERRRPTWRRPCWRPASRSSNSAR